MLSLKKDKKEEEDKDGGNQYSNLEKTSVLQEARLFNETPVNPRKCTAVLAKILYLINQGENLGTTEATETFFAITKLFQARDTVLRRLVYLGIKELSNIAEDVIIVTSSLTKDMTGKEDNYRAAAIRALCTITDPVMLQAIERYMKQAIVDRNPAVSSAALVSSLHLSDRAPEVVKRWVNEVQESMSSDNVMVQYHALGLLYHIRKHDRLAITKLLAKLTKMSLKSPYAVILLIRIACKMIEEEEGDSSSPYFDFVESCLRHKSEMVIYEAAHAIVNMKKTTSRELAPAVSVLQLFCSSPKPTLRFAAVRTLNKVAMTHPAAVTACNLDLENLITDTNRSIATLAITTLLKTGAESSVDRLMKQIATFVSEISDEFKIVVVQAIRSLCQKFPKKHGILLNFLSGMLRDEGGLDYKASIADTIIQVIEENPEAKENGLAHLCEFIEDCEHTILAVKILHLLGQEGPRTANPARYIRFIYNRVLLENATVRAAAVSAMARFGALCDDLLPNVLVLLSRCQMDADDEVRDRATYFRAILEQHEASLNSQYILNNLQVSISSLEKALHSYTLNQAAQAEAFDMKSVPAAAVEEDKPSATLGAISGKPTSQQPTATRHDMFVEKLAGVPAIQALGIGQLFRSSQPVELTESETEYTVAVIKHVFPAHVVFQFDCTNTLADQLLEKARVELEVPEGWELVAEVVAPRLEYNVCGTIYVVLATPEELSECVATIPANLKFTVKDCDPATGEPDSEDGYDDDYQLEDIDVTVADNVSRVMKGNFGAAWEEIGADYELEDTFQLPFKTMDEAVKNIVTYLGMQPCERSDKVPEGKSSHTLLLSGMYRGGIEVLVRAKLALSDGVAMQLTVRSQDQAVSEIMATAVA